MAVRLWIVLISAGVAWISCGDGADPMAMNGFCEGYAKDADQAIYTAPLAAGSNLEVGQGNCSPSSHYGRQRFAYDFFVDIGTEIHAVRAGTVNEVIEQYKDGSPCPNDNLMVVLHDDGSAARYIHLTFEGALAEVGDRVEQGQLIALSGNTGCTSEPHLHLEVRVHNKSIPVTFRNIVPFQRRLVLGETYVVQ